MALDANRYSSLEDALQRVAAGSDGLVEFRKTNTRDLATDLGLKLPPSRNPVYDFHVKNSNNSFRAIAYTLALDGRLRPATRAEALGRGLAQDGGRLFEANPFLLVFDFAGQQLLSVPAVTLFGAFADLAARESLGFAETSTFSVSPNFANGTIAMYALVGAPDVWKCSLADLNGAALAKELQRVQTATEMGRSRISSIVTAIQTRVAQQPTEPQIEPTAISMPAVPSLNSSGDEEVVVDARLWRMLLTAIRSSPAVILVGPPGTGKTALLKRAIEQMIAEGLTKKLPLWATPDESWSARELVGGDTIVSGEIEFRPGWLLRSIAEDRWLVLDEANRADMDRILGPVLTWLSGGSAVVGTTSAKSGSKQIVLGWTLAPTVTQTADEQQSEPRTAFLASADWRLLGTYNALDAQRVFRFGAALGRRFARVPIPAITPAEFASLLRARAEDLPAEIRNRLTRLYEAHYSTDATRIGPAIFLAICNYVRTAQLEDPGSAIESVDQSPSNASMIQEPSPTYGIYAGAGAALAEGYVVHAGTTVAHLEVDELAQLRERISAANIFTPEDVSWISEVIRALA